MKKFSTNIVTQTGENNCAASVSSSLVVHIPIVTYGGSNYWADLQYNSADSTLSVSNAGLISNASSYSSCMASASTLSSDLKLHIPVVILNGLSYWIDLQYVNSVFVITGSGANGSVATANVHKLAAIANYATFFNTVSDSDIQAAAARYNVIIGEPTALTTTQINTLLAGGRNKVLGYLNFTASEDTRDYYNFLNGAPPDPNHPGQAFKSFVQIFPNAEPYAGWSHEYWANPANLDYQNLIVNYVAPKIAAMGFNGFFLDNVELLEHFASDNGKCDAACKQGGYDMLARLRKKYPTFVIIENNATMLTTMNAQVLQDPDNAQSQRVRFIDLLDGVYAEDIYSDPIPDTASAEVISSHPQPRDPAAPNVRLDALKAIKSAFPYIWIGAEDFVEQCTPAYASQSNSYSGYAQRDGLNIYVSTLSQTLCFW